MNTKASILAKPENDILIDFSQENELSYWSSKLNVRPEVIKTAGRACCSNAINQIIDYLNAIRSGRP